MFTQKQVAIALNCTQQYYNHIETGNRQKNITLELLEKLANILDIPITEIIECENKYKAELPS